MSFKRLTYSLSIALAFSCSFSVDAQNITFVEEELKSAVIEQGYDNNDDGEISLEEANLVDQLELVGLDITSLVDLSHFQNIEVFTSLRLLEIENIELKNFQHLKYFSFENNFGVDKAITIKMEDLPKLDTFSVKSLIKNIDFELLPELKYFSAINKAVSNPFDVENFDLSQLPAIEEFVLDKCTVSHLSFSDNIDLKRLTVSISTLNTIDLQGNPNLQYLDLSSSKLNDINLSNNLSLETLDLNFNPLGTHLDISNLPKLKNIHVSNTGLTSIEFENLDSLELLNLNGNYIGTFDQTFQNLRQLHVIGNAMEDLDATRFPKLEVLYCSDIRAQNLDLSDFSTLRVVGCGGEHLQEITFGENENLEYIGISDSQLTAFNVTNKPKLNEISLFRNDSLESVSLHNLPLLDDVSIYVNNVDYFDAKEIDHLSSLRLGRNKLSSIDLSGINSIEDLDLESNEFTSFSLGDVELIGKFNLSYNPLEELDFNSIKDVQDLSLYHVLLTKIDLSPTVTKYLRIDKNLQLDSIIMKNGVNTYINNSGQHPTILNTPNLKYICVDSSEQNSIQTIIDESGLSVEIDLECESFISAVSEDLGAALKVYPNPTSEEFFIELEGAFQVSVFDGLGRLVLDKMMHDEGKVSGLDSGYYFVRVYSLGDGRSYFSRLVVGE